MSRENIVCNSQDVIVIFIKLIQMENDVYNCSCWSSVGR